MEKGAAPMGFVPELRVSEIFTSLQGESTWSGIPCVFVRLTGCNLNCRWCDTHYARNEGTLIPLPEVLNEVLSQQVQLVEITGGEPLLQNATPLLAKELLSAGKTVLVETNGACSVRDLPAGIIRILDLKCPSSGESDKICWDNLQWLTTSDEIKFVIADRVDYEWAVAQVDQLNLLQRTNAVLFSPVWGELSPRYLWRWMVEDRLPIRFSLQQHKVVWGPEKTGV